MFDFSKLSTKYKVKKMGEEDVANIINPELFMSI